jgi:hypothetical protein
MLNIETIDFKTMNQSDLCIKMKRGFYEKIKQFSF